MCGYNLREIVINASIIPEDRRTFLVLSNSRPMVPMGDVIHLNIPFECGLKSGDEAIINEGEFIGAYSVDDLIDYKKIEFRRKGDLILRLYGNEMKKLKEHRK